MSKNTVKKVGSVIAATVLCAYTLVPAYAFGEDSTTGSSSDSTTTSIADSIKNTLSNSDTNSTTTTKEETVYVFAQADGTVKNTVVSNWLKNPDKLDTLTDHTDLTGIENVSGDETFDQTGDALVWNAQGDDIYYQGSTDKAAPISLKVSYKLDGKTVSPDEIAGKSGKVTIRFDYTNNSYTMADIDGTMTKIYTPYVAMTGLILDNANFSNVQVSNGKIINDGDRTIVAGYALPGMQDNLGVDDDTYDIPDYVEITADASDFTLDTSVTMVTGDLFADVDTDDIDTTDITDSLNQLTDAMNQLTNGSSTLYDGLVQLAEGASQVNSGVQQLDTGSQQLSSGTSTLASKTSGLADSASQLNDGASQLSAAATKVDAGLNQLTNGSDTTTGLSDAIASLGDAQTDGTLLNGAYRIRYGIEQVIGTDASVDASGNVTMPTGLKKAQAGAVALSAGAQTAVNSIGTGASDSDATLLKGTAGVNAYLTLAEQALGYTPSSSLASASSSLDTADSALAGIATPVSSAQGELTSAADELNDASDALSAVSDPSQADSALAALESIESDGTLTDAQRAAIEQAEAALSASSDASGVAASAADAASGAASSARDASSACDDASGAVNTADDAISSAQGTISDALSQQSTPDITSAITYMEYARGANTQVTTGLTTMKTQLSGAKAGADSLASGLGTAVDALSQLDLGAQKIYAGLDILENGGQVSATKTSAGLKGAVSALGSASTENTLLYGTGSIKSGLSKLSAGTATLAEQSPALVSGIQQISGGASQLTSGLDTLASNTPSLASGAQSAADGSKTLSDGLNQFNEQGVQKIVDAFGGDLGELTDRVKATVDAGKDSTPFGGKTDAKTTSTKFVIETDGISED